VKISLSNPERTDLQPVILDATVNTGVRSATVARSIVHSLGLPSTGEAKTYACVEYSGARSVIELQVSDTSDSVVLSQAALMALGVEFDPFTGIPVLH
jgi:hypothetical protein